MQDTYLLGSSASFDGMAVLAYAKRTNYDMIGPVRVSTSDIYAAVLALSRSIAGRNDLESLLSGVAEAIRRIVRFEHIALTLHDANHNEMHGHILSSPGGTAIRSLRLPIDQDPAGWVWSNQKPLLIPSLDTENRWPAFHPERSCQGCLLDCSCASHSRRQPVGRIRIWLRFLPRIQPG